MSLTKGGVGTWALSGTNTYSGLTTMAQANPIGAGLTFQGIQALSPNTDFTQTHSGGTGGHAPFRVLDDSATPASRSGVDLTFNHSNNSMNTMTVFVGNNSTANGGTSPSSQTGSTIQLGNMNFNQSNIGQTAGTQLFVTGANGYKLQIGKVNISLQAAFAGAWPTRLNATSAPLIVGGNVQQLAGSAGTATLQLDGTATGSQISGNVLNSADGTPKALSLTKIGSGTWTLTGANTYSGATTISTGSLQLGDGTFGKDGTIENTSGITNNATLVFNRFGNLSSNVGISGTGAVTKTGAGSQTLSGTSGYAGVTTVSAGKLFINGNHSTATGAVSVSADASLGGTGIVGGNTTIAANGKLEFSLTTDAVNHDKLDLAAAKTLTFSGASEMTITSSGGASSGLYTLVTAPGGIVGSAPATLSLPPGWTGSVSKVGNDLVLNLTVPDTTPPTLVSIADDQGGGPVVASTPVTYTLTFSEDITTASVEASDFGNAATAAITIGTITKTSPGVFAVEVTPTSPGSLHLQVNAGAVITDIAGNPLDTIAAISDSTVITVNPLMITVPNVVGLTQAAAGSDIVAANLVVGTVTTQNHLTIPADSVISQSPVGGASVEPSSAVDLVVSLDPPTYTVSYSANSATSGTAPTDQTKAYDVNLTLATNSGNLARTDHIFSGWNTAADGNGTDYAPGGTYTDNAAVTLYAKWAPKEIPTVNTWPTAATIQVGQALSSATLIGGSASVAGSFSYNNPSLTPMAGIYIADVTFTPNDTENYSNVSGTVDVTVLTEFEGWAGGETTFSGDSNDDGLPDGLAWLLGATDPDQNASALLPVVGRVDGNMVMGFQFLKASKRGPSVISLQTSADLGSNDAWSGHSVPIPETSGTVDGVVFVITPVEGTDFLQVQASVPMIGNSLFMRLEGIPSSP